MRAAGTEFSEPVEPSHGDPEPMGSASGPARDLPAVPSPGPADPVVAVPPANTAGAAEPKAAPKKRRRPPGKNKPKHRRPCGK